MIENIKNIFKESVPTELTTSTYSNRYYHNLILKTLDGKFKFDITISSDWDYTELYILNVKCFKFKWFFYTDLIELDYDTETELKNIIMDKFNIMVKRQRQIEELKRTKKQLEKKEKIEKFFS